MTLFSILKSEIVDGVILSLTGELDASSAHEAELAIEDAMQSHKFILVDCEQLIYISSAGLGVFLATYQACRQQNIALMLFNMSAKIRNVFEIVGLHYVLTIVPTQDDALLLTENSCKDTVK